MSIEKLEEYETMADVLRNEIKEREEKLQVVLVDIENLNAEIENNEHRDILQQFEKADLPTKLSMIEKRVSDMKDLISNHPHIIFRSFVVGRKWYTFKFSAGIWSRDFVVLKSSGDVYQGTSSKNPFGNIFRNTIQDIINRKCKP